MRDLFKADYGAHETLVRTARMRPQLWRLGLGIAIILAVQWALQSGLWRVLYQMLSDAAYREIYYDFDRLLLPQSALILLYSFATAWAGVLVALHVMHGRALRDAVGPAHVFWRQLLDGGKWMAVLMAAGLSLALLQPADITPGLMVDRWLAFLLPALLGVAIQTSAEEVMFRGYLQQQLAARFHSPLVWMLVPSVLFGLLHYQPSVYPGNAGLVVIWATVFGLMAADLTARAGTLAPAIALHFFVNVGTLVFISPQGDLSGLALYQLTFATTDTAAVRAYLPIDLLGIACAWLALRVALRR